MWSVKSLSMSLIHEVIVMMDILHDSGVVGLFTSFEQFVQVSMQVLGSCPLPVAPGVEDEGVVVVEEGNGRQQQEDGQQGGHQGQSAQGHDTPDDDEQGPQGEVHTQAGGVAEGLVLESAYDIVRQCP